MLKGNSCIIKIFVRYSYVATCKKLQETKFMAVLE